MLAGVAASKYLPQGRVLTALHDFFLGDEFPGDLNALEQIYAINYASHAARSSGSKGLLGDSSWNFYFLEKILPDEAIDSQFMARVLIYNPEISKHGWTVLQSMANKMLEDNADNQGKAKILLEYYSSSQSSVGPQAHEPDPSHDGEASIDMPDVLKGVVGSVGVMALLGGIWWLFSDAEDQSKKA